MVSYYGHYRSVRPEAEIYLALRRRGYRIGVITHGDSEYVDRFRENGIRVLYGHPTRRRDPGATAVIRRELTEGDYDVVILYNSRAIANGVRAARGIDVKVVAYRGYADDLRWYDPSNYLKTYHPRVDAILCNNVGVQQHIRANLFGRRDRTYVINKGHDLAWYDDSAPISRERLDVPEEAPLLVCLANALPFKGVPYLLEAFNRLDPSLGAHLVLCGRHMDTPANRRLVSRGTYPERVHFLGFREDAWNIIAAADLKVLPSIKGESLTKAALEAMAIGTPVLITDIPGNEELVEHDVSGWKVRRRSEDALKGGIERLLKEPALRDKLARGARERLAGPLSHARTVESMDAFFRSLLANEVR